MQQKYGYIIQSMWKAGTTLMVKVLTLLGFSDEKNGQQGDCYIIHSMWKTGTTSMAKALILLGFSDREHGWKENLGKKYEERILAANRMITSYDSISHIHPNIKSAVQVALSGLPEELNDHSIFSDYPIGHTFIHPFVKKILFPNSKFIWIDRELDSWVKSVIGWKELKKDVLNLESSTSENDATIKSEYFAKRLELEKLAKDFPQDVLFMNLSDGWEPLCKFLNVNIPDIPFPFENKNKNKNKNKNEN